MKIQAHPETDSMSSAQLLEAIGEAEEKLQIARKVGDVNLEAWFTQEVRTLEAGLARRNGTPPAPAIDGDDPITQTLTAAGWELLNQKSSLAEVELAIRNLVLALNGADTIRCATVREAAIKKLEKIGIKGPARLIDAALPANPVTSVGDPGQGIIFQEPEPWPKIVNGSDLLEEIVSFIERFVVLPPHGAEAIALWILHAHALKAFEISPILAITSPTKRAGKTLLLEMLSMLTPRSMSASNITPASFFRSVEKFKPTLLIDEADTFLLPHRPGEKSELRGVIDASHRRSSAFVVRTIGEDHEPHVFSTWCAKAIALIGKLPDTLEDRAIVIHMRRRMGGEAVERFRPDRLRSEFQELKQKALRWSADQLRALRDADPPVPPELNDRAADSWRPLLGVAALAGGPWPSRAQTAALALAAGIIEEENSALIQLLGDLKELFHNLGVDRIPSADIVAALGSRDDRAWSEWRHGKPITQRQLARLLGSLHIVPHTIRTAAGTTHRGYLLEQFIDPFSRYLGFRSATPPQPTPRADAAAICDPQHETAVADEKTSLSTRQISNVADVADRKGVLEPEEGWERIR